MDAVTTRIAKKKILLARANGTTLPKIVKMAFGSGGTDERGIVLKPTEDQRTLKNEIGRFDISSRKIVSETQVTYSCKIAEGELNGSSISEIALVDADGDLLTIKNFTPKKKESNFSFIFSIDDTM